MAVKKFEELDLNNAFLFAAALEDSETCKLILELIFGQALPKVSVRVEHSMFFSSDFRSIRLDVYAQDELQIGYDLEMQNEDKKTLPKRSRFYQAEIDVGALKPGDDFENLKPSYIIFICTFDPFEDQLYRYTFEERCLERDFPLGDGTRKIFLSTKGNNSDEVPAELVHFLHYLENSSDEYVKHIEDTQIGRLHEKISSLKRNRRWREQYMTFDELLRKSEEKGREAGYAAGQEAGHEAGLAEGEGRMLLLISRMIENGEADSVSRLSEDLDYREKMYQKYHV